MLARTTTVFLIGLILCLSGCQLPLGQASRVGLKLTVSATSSDRGASRLLLPTASTITVTSTKISSGKTLSQSAVFNGVSATFTLSLEPHAPYTIAVTANDASGVSVFAGSAPIIPTGSNSLAINLLPVEKAGAPWSTAAASNQGSTVVGLTALAAGSSATYIIDFETTGSLFTFPSLPAGLEVYAQKLDGAALSAASGFIARSSLGSDSRFLLTYYQRSGGPGSLSSVGDFTIPATSVTLSPATLTLGVSSFAFLTPTVAPANSTEKAASDFTWVSSDTDVATVSAAGLVTAVGSGAATITATSKTSAVNGSASVTVPVAEGTLSLGFTPYEALGFSLSSFTIPQATSLSVVTATGGSGWSWWADATSLSSVQTGANASVNTTGLAPGSYELSVHVTYGGILYSASTILNIEQVEK